MRPGDKPTPLVNLYEVKSDGRRKVRTIVLGNRVQKGEDENNYAPVVDMTTLRVLLGRIVNEQLYTCGCDISEAYLNAALEERVVVRPPEEYRKRSGFGYWVPKRAVYGLRQSPAAWDKHMHEKLLTLGWRRSSVDACYYTKQTPQGTVHMLCYVDDYLLTGPAQELVENERNKILELFPRGGRKLDPDESGTLRFLGLDITFAHALGEVRVSQATLIATVAERFGLADAGPAKAKKPFEGFLNEEGTPAPPGNEYRSIVGSLMYLAVNTRIDI